MIIARLLDRAHDQGIEIALAADGENLTLSGPAEVLPKVAAHIRKHKTQIIAHLKDRDRVSQITHSAAPSAAAEIISTCQQHNVRLRMDGDDLVVESNGNAWTALIDAIEKHLEEVVAILINDPEAIKAIGHKENLE